ncbi:hypothetical protein [Desmospora activa]|uniref:hypothetical protein n=1 Tax=Desmospora activa TaxID=500615 RepID=UPI0011B20C9B|nr:hypothetical protein [Desmospora activa]
MPSASSPFDERLKKSLLSCLTEANEGGLIAQIAPSVTDTTPSFIPRLPWTSTTVCNSTNEVTTLEQQRDLDR